MLGIRSAIARQIRGLLSDPASPRIVMAHDGSGLFAHCSTQLHHVRRAYPFRSVRLVDHDLSVDFARRNQIDDRMTVSATKPLTTGEEGVAFAPGELKYFCDGTETQPYAAPARHALPA